VGHVACLAVKRKVYKILIGKPEGKKSIQKTYMQREDIKMDARMWNKLEDKRKI
jgi:hypothetical protein